MRNTFDKNAFVVRALACGSLTLSLAFSGCACAGPSETTDAASESTEQVAASSDATTATGTTTAPVQDEEVNAQTSQSRLDLLVLVNPTHRLPDGWEESLDLVEVVNPKGDTVQIDRIAYDAFLELQSDLAAQGITIELNSGFRSVAAQQEIWDDFMVEYGEDYVNEFVAKPGYSEHHTGLALDAYLVLDGVPQLTNDEIFAAQDTWDLIHAALADHGFILRYLDGADDITGFSYEPWHFRYVGVKDAKQIMDRGITLEEYLGEA